MTTPIGETTTTRETNLASVRLESDNVITLEPRKLFEIKTPDGQITDDGKSEIQHFLYYKEMLPKLPSDFDWIWTTNRGTFPKRVQSFYYKEHKLKLTTDQISELGNMARRHSSNGETYILDFTNRFDWSSGDFGDGGSCFWGDRSGAREMLESNGAYAVRGFKRKYPIESEILDYGNVRGYARAWLAPVGTNLFVLFNGYGENALTFARLLALKWNCSYKRIELYNNGDSDGTLYINGSNFVIGQHSVIQSIESHDFGWRDVQSSREFCPACEGYYHEDNGIYCESEDVTVCSDCATRCEDCRNWFSDNIDDRSRFNYATLCNGCYESRIENESEVTI